MEIEITEEEEQRLATMIKGLNTDSYVNLTKIIRTICNDVCFGHIAGKKEDGGDVDCHRCPLYFIVLVEDGEIQELEED